jgi:nicotinate-nucleotide adenylyltransferase
MRIGLLGGTFNPVHLGHLLLAETAREQLRLDRVLFVPSRVPPHKRTPDLLPAALRLGLVRLAIRGHHAFAASGLELSRPGVSYTIDTVRALKRRWPRATLVLLVGADLLRVRWVAWEELRRLCTLAVASRVGDAPARLRGAYRLAMPPVGISSSDIRRRLRRGQSIRYLVPEAVERSLRAHRAFRRRRSR